MPLLRPSRPYPICPFTALILPSSNLSLDYYASGSFFMLLGIDLAWPSLQTCALAVLSDRNALPQLSMWFTLSSPSSPCSHVNVLGTPSLNLLLTTVPHLCLPQDSYHDFCIYLAVLYILYFFTYASLSPSLEHHQWKLLGDGVFSLFCSLLFSQCLHKCLAWSRFSMNVS